MQHTQVIVAYEYKSGYKENDDDGQQRKRRGRDSKRNCFWKVYSLESRKENIFYEALGLLITFRDSLINRLVYEALE